MDKVQIYFCIYMLLGLVGTGMRLSAVSDNPNGTEPWTNTIRLRYNLACYIIVLPIAGRIFGWW
jgi:hypothetical protein